MTLERLRSDIDRIDARLLSLLDERMEKALLTRRLKTGTLDPSREAEILARVAARSRCLAREEFTTGLYRSLMAESRALQDAGLRLVGFQGMHGAYSESAVRAWDADAAAIPFPEFSQVFDGVLAGNLDFGVVPVENTLGGIVGQVNSILVTTQLRVVAAVDMPVAHCLLAAPGQDHREIRTAYSHPQALAQCRRFLERNKLDAVAYFDTAGAARMIAEERPKGAAAIAGRFRGGTLRPGDHQGRHTGRSQQPDALLRALPDGPGGGGQQVLRRVLHERQGRSPVQGPGGLRAGRDQPDADRVGARRTRRLRDLPGFRGIRPGSRGRSGRQGGVRARRATSGSWAATRKRGSDMRIAILGAGRMGAWLAETLAAGHELVLRDTDSERAERVTGVRALLADEEIRDFEPELLVNCVPLGFTVGVFRQILPLLPESCMLSDIASVKTGFGEFYREAGRPFVSTHPMFGPTYADVQAPARRRMP